MLLTIQFNHLTLIKLHIMKLEKLLSNSEYYKCVRERLRIYGTPGVPNNFS